MGLGVSLILIAVGAVMAWPFTCRRAVSTFTPSATSCWSSAPSAHCSRSCSGQAGRAPATSPKAAPAGAQ